MLRWNPAQTEPCTAETESRATHAVQLSVPAAVELVPGLL